jgi:hypothetical protein
VLLILLSMSCLVLPVQTATQADIDAAIASGLEWLAANQNVDGSWGTYYEVGHTGFVLLKLETHAIQTGWDPLDPAYEYYSNVSAGLDYIFSMATNVSIPVQTAGDPDTNGNGLGTYFAVGVGHSIYETSVAMMAIAASTHPEMVVNVPGSVVNGRTYFDVLQDAVDFLAFAQTDMAAGTARGGWRYSANQGTSDNSIAGLATLGLAYAEATQIEGATGFGCTVPQFVRDELNIWVDYIQGDVTGGSGYHEVDYWENILKTGNLLVQMAFLGDMPNTQRVIDAIGFIETHWNDPNNGYNPGQAGWRGSPASYLAVFATVKGLDAFGIQTINNGTEVDWFNEMADVVLDQQNADGSWPQPIWGSPVLGTAWCMLFLQRVTAIEPPPVGGSILSVESLTLLAPYIIALIAVATAATAIIKKRRL